MTQIPPQKWPREIWMGERVDHDQGVVTAVLSEHATVARWVGDKEHDREFHRYIDADIHDSALRYHASQMQGEVEARLRLDNALRQKEQAMDVLFELLRQNDVDYSHLIL